MQKQPIYNNRNKVHVKPSKISKKHYFFQKSNHFYDFFEQKVIIMTKKKYMTKVDALRQSHIKEDSQLFDLN